VLGVVLMVAPAWTHHSQVMYDETKMVTVEGVVARFQWANPHSWLWVDVTANGTTQQWGFEANSAASLTRAGWQRTDFKAGDVVTVAYHPAKNGSPKGYLRKVSGNGKTYEIAGNTPPKTAK
jgi:hypothetical protein